MKNQNILNNSYAANILYLFWLPFYGGLKTSGIYRSVRHDVERFMRFFLFLAAFPSYNQLGPKIIILNHILKVDNIFNRGSNIT